MKVVPSSSTALVKSKDAIKFSGGCLMNTPVTPGFKDKTECITICMPRSSSMHIVTSLMNNQQ
jgi:hypothetical protein